MFDLFVYAENRPLIFTQAFFWVFFGGVLIGYFFTYQNINKRNFFLMLVSMYFYYLSSGYYFILLVFSTLVDYYLGKAIYTTDDVSKRKFYVTMSLLVNLATLAYFKYTYFFTDTFNTLFATNIEVVNFLAYIPNLLGIETDIHRIFLPIGISFYTFQTISYSVDIYRRQLTPVKNIWDFAFYVSFFPQLVAGPIVRASDFIPQIYQKYKLTEAEYSRAIFLIMGGLVKKIFISDYISVNFVDRVYDAPTSYSGFENLLATYGYSIQIYCDFSGYTDIAIGLSLLLGFRLNLNFNSPYKAVNITDFWRRWHISLSSWLRDYLYISLGGNRKGRLMTYFNLLITMLLGGLWHGAAFRFIVWGALHGVALAIHKVWLEYFIKDVKKVPSFASRLISGAITFHFVAFCWIFFRAADMATAWAVITQIFTSFHPELISTVLFSYGKIVSVIALGFILHWLPSEWKNRLSDMFLVLPDIAKATVIFFLALLLFQVKTSELQPFIYFQF